MTPEAITEVISNFFAQLLLFIICLLMLRGIFRK